MSDTTVHHWTPQGTARVLSAVLQSLVAEEIGGDTSTAFMQEFRAEYVTARQDPVSLARFYAVLNFEMSGALYSLAKYTAQQNGEEPRAVLEHLIRTYRGAVATDE